MRATIFAVALAIGVLVSGLFAWDANASFINCTNPGPVLGTECSILDSGQSAQSSDGTTYVGDPNPSLPSTGSGVFKPFLETHTPTSGSVESGFNTDAQNSTSPGGVNFDTTPRGGNVATRSVLFSELGTVTCPTGGSCYLLQLDADQTSKATVVDNQITISNLQIFIADDSRLKCPECVGGGINNSGYAGTQFDGSSTVDTLLTHAPTWCMDSLCGSGNSDVDLILQASICSSPGQCGSGHGDLDVFIPVELLGSNIGSTAQFVLYTEYGGCVGLNATNCPGPNDGPEEWRFFGAAAVPEPTSLLLLGSGLIGLGLWQWKRRSGVQI